MITTPQRRPSTNRAMNAMKDTRTSSIYPVIILRHPIARLLPPGLSRLSRLSLAVTAAARRQSNGVRCHTRGAARSLGDTKTMTNDAQRSSTRPDVIVILVDDMGYSDLGCYGGEIDTPHLDSLAAAGIRYTQFYNCARCCPTRAALLTGLYPHRAGIGHMTSQGHRNLDFNRAIRPRRLPGLPEQQHRHAGRGAQGPTATRPSCPGSGTSARSVPTGPRTAASTATTESSAAPATTGNPKPTAQLLDGETPVTELPQDFYTTDYFSRRAAGSWPRPTPSVPTSCTWPTPHRTGRCTPGPPTSPSTAVRTRWAGT